MVKYVSLMSGGIDSPVATHLMLSRGAELAIVHFDNRPFTDDVEIEKVGRLVDRLRQLHGDVPAYLVPHGETSQVAIAQGAPRRLGCVLCRRMMFRVASRIAREMGASGIVTGESLGQVASQTLANIRAEQPALEGIPAVRPLIGIDKEEIVRIAKEIGTFDISTDSGMCCTIVPNKPSVAARIHDLVESEDGMDLEGLVSSAMERMVSW